MLKYSIIQASQFDAVIEHLRVHFPDEPLTSTVGLRVRGVAPSPALENGHLKTMQEGLSVMAVDKEKDKIVGVALNRIYKKGDTELAIEEMKSMDNLPYKLVFGLFCDVNKDIDLFSKYGVDKLIDLKLLSVDSDYRRRGIGKELCRQSEKIARENGYKVIKVDATSCFTQKLTKSLGYSVEKSVNYHDYQYENGEKIYDTKPPHLHYQLVVKLLK